MTGPSSTWGSSPLARGLRVAQTGEALGSGIIPARAGFTAVRRRGARRPADHPRSRGVYIVVFLSDEWDGGSSPLARGLHEPVDWADMEYGIIPARAGFTRAGSARRSARADHPRSRGVYGWETRIVLKKQGSSPLARGLPSGSRSCEPGRRIIPARAGFTTTAPSPTTSPPDHPRSRGVYAQFSVPAALARGSSPLARGLQRVSVHRRWRSRIIPARAGFTRPGPSTASPMPDHPRSRGVYIPRPTLIDMDRGSSPLARGLPALVNEHRAIIGIIPARAGFTGAPREIIGLPEDHPRSRGVYTCAIPDLAASEGSSPLARGLPVLRLGTPSCPGIIPARAGFTRRRGHRRFPLGDHPRSRGVYTRMAPSGIVLIGSSPLARGLPSEMYSEYQGIADHPRSRGVYVY